jgi:hypothetical protein
MTPTGKDVHSPEQNLNTTPEGQQNNKVENPVIDATVEAVETKVNEAILKEANKFIAKFSVLSES